MSKRAMLLLACLMLGGCTALGKMGQVIMNPSIQVGGPGEQLSQFSLSLYASPTVNLNSNSTLGESPTLTHVKPSPLAVNLSAGDPLELTDKLQAVIEQLQREYPAMSSVEFDGAEQAAFSPLVPALGDFDDPHIQLGIAHPETPAPDKATPIFFQVLQLKDDSLLLTAQDELLGNNLKQVLGSTLVQVDDYRLMPGDFKFVDLEEIDKATRYLAVIAHYRDRDNIEWRRSLRIAPQGHQHAILIQLQDDGVVLKGES